MRSGEPFEASVALERVIAKQPQHAGARLELVAVYIQLNQLDSAERQLDVLDTLNAPTRAQEAIDRFRIIVGQRREQKSENPQFISLSIDMGYDSNYLNYPDSFDLFANTILQGLAILEADSTTYTNVRGMAWKRWNAPDGAFLEGSLLAQARINHNSAARIFDTNIIHGALFVGSRIGSGSELRFGLEGSQLWLDNTSYRSQTGINIGWKTNLNKTHELLANGAFREFRFHESRNDYIAWSGDVEWRYTLSPLVRLRAKAGTDVELVVKEVTRQGGALSGNAVATLLTHANSTWLKNIGNLSAITAQRDDVNYTYFQADDANKYSSNQPEGGFIIDTAEGPLYVFWGHWQGDGYQLFENYGGFNALDNNSNYHFVFASYIVPESELPQAGKFNFEFAAGSGLTSDHNGRVIPLTEGNISVNFDLESIAVMLLFDDNGEQLSLMGNSQSLYDFFAQYGGLHLAGSGFDSGLIYGALAGENINALIALIEAYKGNETFRGTGVFTYQQPLELPSTGQGLTLSGFLDHPNAEHTYGTRTQGDNEMLTYVSTSDMMFNTPQDSTPELSGTFYLENWSPTSNTVIRWGNWAPGTYSLTDNAGYNLSNEHYFPYLMSTEYLMNWSELNNTFSSVHAHQDTLTFKLGGGTGVNLSNAERIELGDNSRIFVDLNNGNMGFELDFTYSADQTAVLRTLFGSGSVEEFYDSFIALEETTAGEKIINLARMYGSFTGNEDAGIDALLTGLYLAIQDNGSEATGFGLHYFLYCWMGNSCEVAPPYEPSFTVQTGLTERGFIYNGLGSQSDTQVSRLQSLNSDSNRNTHVVG